MAVHCEKCGARVASRAALPGHYRRAHPRKSRHSATLVPVESELVRSARLFSARPGTTRSEVLDVTPSRSEIIPASRPILPTKGSPLHILTPDLADAEAPPSWWEPQAERNWRIRQWNAFSADYRNRLLAQRAGTAFSIRPPKATDEVILWSQYHALKALATRLDAGIGTERERVSFEAGLREYNTNFDRIRAQRKS